MSNQNNSFQSQFVPAEKPYTVYAFVWGGENTTVAQLIGTMVTGTIDEKGNVKYTTNAVYRCPSDRMLAFEHCFIEGHTDEITTNDTYLLGRVGDTVGMEALSQVSWLEQYEANDDFILNYSVKLIKAAGLTLEIDTSKLRIQKGRIIDRYTKHLDESVPCLEIHDQIALFANLGEKKAEVISEVARKLRELAEIGIDQFQAQMEDESQQACYDGLMEVTKIFNSHYRKPDNAVYSDIKVFLVAREYVGRNTCTKEELLAALSKKLGTEKESEDYIQSGIENKLIINDGDIIRFCDDIERMMSWEPVF
jgi:hypothetical protein